MMAGEHMNHNNSNNNRLIPPMIASYLTITTATTTIWTTTTTTTTTKLMNAPKQFLHGAHLPLSQLSDDGGVGFHANESQGAQGVRQRNVELEPRREVVEPL